MTQDITLAIDEALLERARLLAADRGATIQQLLEGELRRIVERDDAYLEAQASALAYLAAPFHLGGKGITDREALHDRQSLR